MAKMQDRSMRQPGVTHSNTHQHQRMAMGEKITGQSLKKGGRVASDKKVLKDVKKVAKEVATHERAEIRGGERSGKRGGGRCG
jgi:hypothetical protein